MRSMRLVSWLMVSALAAAACGGNEASSGGSNAGNGGGGDDAAGGNEGTSITVEQLPAKYAEAFCEVFTRCAGDLYGIFRPGERCMETYAPAAEEALATL